MNSREPGGHDPGRPPIGVLRRAARILDVFAAEAGTSPAGLTLTQVALVTGLPQASVHRTLEQLVALDWLRREGMRYRLGMRMVELGSAAVNDDALRLAALPSLRWLHQQTGCIVQLGVLDGDDVVYLERIGGESVSAIKTRAGSRMPARQSTIGTALLALASSPCVVDLEVMRVRESRIAYKRDGCLEGFACLAAPIGPQGYGRAAAISVFGPARRVDNEQRVRIPLQSAAAAIWQRLNAPATPRTVAEKARA